MASPSSVLYHHILPLQILKDQHSYLFEPVLLPTIPPTVDVKAAFYFVKQKLYFAKEKYTNLIRDPVPSILSVGEAVTVLGIVTEFLRVIENHSDLYAIHMYRLTVQNVTGQLPL